MKKILAVILALMLCCSFALFAACDDQPAGGPGGNGGGNEATGEIEGNYEETTSEDLATTLSSIDISKLLGNMESEDWSFGASVDGEVSLKVTMAEQELNATASLSYAISVAKGTSEQVPFDIKGKGEIKMEGVVPVSGSAGPVSEAPAADSTATAETEFSIAVTIYNDSTAFYLDVSGKAGDDNLDTQVKISYENILGLISGSGMVPGPDTMAADASGETGSDSANILSEVVAILDQLGVKVGVDTSDGVRIKLSADKATLNTIVQMVVQKIIGSSAAGMEIPVTVGDGSAVDIYFAIDKDGRFFGAAIDATASTTIGKDFTSLEEDIVGQLDIALNVSYKANPGVSLDGLNPDDYSEFSFGSSSDSQVKPGTEVDA